MPAVLALFPAFNSIVQAGILSLWLGFSSFCCFSLPLLFKGQPPIVGINSQCNSCEWRGWLTALDLSSIVNTSTCNPIGTVLRICCQNSISMVSITKRKCSTRKTFSVRHWIRKTTLSRFCYWSLQGSKNRPPSGYLRLKNPVWRVKKSF